MLVNKKLQTLQAQQGNNLGRYSGISSLDSICNISFSVATHQYIENTHEMTLLGETTSEIRTHTFVKYYGHSFTQQ